MSYWLLDAFEGLFDGQPCLQLLAEGLRKFGLLWLLVRNGTLIEGSVSSPT